MLRLGAIVLVLSFAAACQCIPRCDGANCGGCCDSSGECQSGTNTVACGVEGQRCFTCSTLVQACSKGACVPAAHGASGVLAGGSAGGVSNGSAGGVSNGSGGGSAAGGVAPQPFGDLLANVGHPCTAVADTPGGECSPQLTCLPVVGTSRFACQYACANGVCGGTGRCQVVVEAGRSCTDCLRPCVGVSSCLPDELCVPRGTGSVCMPNCLLVGAECPAPQQCLASGLCSQGGLVSYCLRF